MADNNPLSDPELRHLERRLSELALPPSRHERERLLYACGQAAGRAQMKRRVQAATAVAAICLFVSLGLGFTLLTRGGSQTAAVESTLAPVPRVFPAVPITEVPPVDEPTRSDRAGGQLTATSSFQQLIAFDQPHTVRPRSVAVPDVPPQRILTAADSVLPDEL
jgi:hypothetical protein